MRFREYQSRAIDFLQSRQRAFIVAPAGSGKTLMAAGAAAKRANPFDSILWLANTNEQCGQAREAVARVEWPNPVSFSAHCVAAKPNVSGADIIIIDEAHHLPAKTWWESVVYSDAKIWGFSATPFSGVWERDAILKAFFLEENFLVIPRAEVQEGGSITAAHVYIHDVDTPGEFNEWIETNAMQEAIKRHHRMKFLPLVEHLRRTRSQFTSEKVRANVARNEKIVELAKGRAATLILVSTIEHGQQLGAEIPGSVVVFSKMGAKRRREAMAAFKAGSVRVMIATSLADEGLDVPIASVLILAAGGRSARLVEQRTGRVLRPFEGKSFGIIHDFSDRGADMAHNQALSRFKIYKRLKYKIQ